MSLVGAAEDDAAVESAVKQVRVSVCYTVPSVITAISDNWRTQALAELGAGK